MAQDRRDSKQEGLCTKQERTPSHRIAKDGLTSKCTLKSGNRKQERTRGIGINFKELMISAILSQESQKCIEFIKEVNVSYRPGKNLWSPCRVSNKGLKALRHVRGSG